MRPPALVLWVVCLVGCDDRSGPPVELVVPVGFTGTVRVMLDPAGPEIPLIDGRYQIVVPLDGLVRVRSFRPLEQWHTLAARYTDGTLIPRDHGDGTVGPNTVAVRGGVSSVTSGEGRGLRSQTYFVGTAGQRTDVPADRDAPAEK
jgi:hypothetical protein